MICKLWHSLHNLIPNMKESERFRTGRRGRVQSCFQHFVEIARQMSLLMTTTGRVLVCRRQLVKSLKIREIRRLDTNTEQSTCSAQSIDSAKTTKTQNLALIKQTWRMATPCCIAVQTAKIGPSILTPCVYSPPPLKVTFSCHSIQRRIQSVHSFLNVVCLLSPTIQPLGLPCSCAIPSFLEISGKGSCLHSMCCMNLSRAS